MPLHDFMCRAGHVTERYVEHGVESIPCQVCVECNTECAATHMPGYDVLHIGFPAYKVFLRAPMGIVRDVRYESPIDGRAITTKQSRAEDMARNNCVAYDPDMKQDYLRRQKDADSALGRKADALVEEQIHAMPARKRELLDQEFRAGADVSVARSTVGG